MFPVFPILGLMALSGAARDRGHDVTVLDLSYRRYDPSLIEAAIRELQPAVVGITAASRVDARRRASAIVASAVRNRA